jgi:ABC-type transport system involved in multi-copper enzyme maturation permease subunit
VIWLAWRHRRGAILVTATVLLGAGVILLLTGRSMAASFHNDGLDACIAGLRRASFVSVDGGCQDEAAAFAARYFPLRLLGLAVFTFVPLVFGMFWGAPVIARELEDDTASLAWTQGVSRRRWTWAQLGFVALVTVIAMGVFSCFVTWWYGPLNAATGDRFQWLIYDQQGVVPVGYALFAVLCAAFIGAVTGRTMRAMAVTALGFVLVRFSVAVWLRPRFMHGLERTYPVVGDRVPNHLLGDWLYGGGGPGAGAVLAANGDRIAGGQRICSPLDQACVAESGRGAYNLELFHPASRFWTFQTIELAIFVALAIALAGATVWWVRRRLV